MSKRRKSKLDFCLFGPSMNWCLNDKNICLELTTWLTVSWLLKLTTWANIYIYIYNSIIKKLKTTFESYISVWVSSYSTSA